MVVLAPFTAGVTLVLAWLIACLAKNPATPWLAEHFAAVRVVFWWSLFWAVVGYILTMLIVGWLILATLSIWLWYRAAMGLKRLNEQRAPY